MKRIFKLTFAAVGLISLASCSNDDLFQNEAFNGLQDDKGTLVVIDEQVNDEFGLSGVTRALTNEDMTKTVWQSTDKIKVYDNQLHIWDGYQFSGNKFALFTEADLTAPKYALYPFGKNETASNGSTIEGTMATIGGVKNTNWSKGGVTKATMTIPSTYYYEEGTLTDGTTPAFWCSIPKWGKVTDTGDNKLEVELKNMVAILRISLQNAEGNVGEIKVSAFKDDAMTKKINLWGDFEATLDTVDFTNTYLAETLGNNNVLTVNVSELTAAQAYVFVPIVPCKNAVLKIDYYDLNGNLIAGKSKTLSQKNYVRNTLYKAKGPEFDVNVASPAAITKALNAAKAQTDPIEVKATVEIYAADDDNTITIPAGMKADQITLNLANGLDGTTLYIEDEDSENAYTGTVVLKNGGTATTTVINASLKKATLAYVGEFSATTNQNYVKGLVVGDNQTLSSVKAGTLSDYIEAVDIKANATIDKLEFNETNKVASIKVSGTVNGAIGGGDLYSKMNADVTVAVNDDVETPFAALVNGAIRTKGNVTVTSGKATATTKAISNAGNVTVTKGTEAVTTGTIYSNVAKGSTVTIAATGATIGAVTVTNATGTINVTNPVAYGTINAPKSSVTISSENVFAATSKITASELTLSGKVAHTTGAIATGDLTIKDESSIDNATATGNVTISATKEMEVVSGTLTMKNEAAGSTLALNAGYVNKVALVATDTKGDVTLTLGKAQTAIATVTNDSEKKFITSKSEWDGKAIKSDESTFDKYRQAANIYTASQLASLAATENVTLMTNIDLMGSANTKGWTCPALNANFNGNGKKISNLYLKAEVAEDAAADKTNFGLFSTIADGKKVSDLTIETVTTALTDARTTDAYTIKNVGALAGSAEGAVIVDKVTVTGAALTSDVKIENVGGLIGSTTGIAYIGYTSTSDASENAVAVTTTNIKGQYNLGGLIGFANAAVNLNKTTATVGAINVVDHTNPTIGETANDPKAGSVGMFVGSLGGNLVLVGSSTYGTTKIDRNAQGFKRNYYANVVSGNLKVYYYYGGYDGVGIYTGATDLTVNGKTVVPNAEMTQLAKEEVSSELYNQYLLSTKW